MYKKFYRDHILLKHEGADYYLNEVSVGIGTIPFTFTKLQDMMMMKEKMR